MDDDNASTQVQDDQSRTNQEQFNAQSSGTVIGDLPSSAELDKDEPVPRAKKRRATEAPKTKELDSTEDDGEAMLVLLNMAHFQFQKAPNGRLNIAALLYCSASLFRLISMTAPILSNLGSPSGLLAINVHL